MLDNCEHLVDACAQLAERAAARLPGLRILATSREPLGVAGEIALAACRRSRCPTPEAPPASTAWRAEAVRLFVDRARAALPGFALDRAQRAGASPTLCRAAGRHAAGDRAGRGAAARARRRADRGPARRPLPAADRRQPHRACRASRRCARVLDWSHDLLSEPERVLLRRPAVFAGGFTLEALGTVAALDDPFELLASLVNKSLIVADVSPNRFHLLETVRQYAAEKLAAADDDSVTRGRHVDWCLDLARRAEAELRGARQADWLDRLEPNTKTCAPRCAGASTSPIA